MRFQNCGLSFFFIVLAHPMLVVADDGVADTTAAATGTPATVAGDAGESKTSDPNAILMTIPNSVELRFSDPRQTKLKLFPRPILNWSNPIRQTPAGAVFLWTHHGRPVVAMCGYPNIGNIDYEFQSLTTIGLAAENADRESTWRPDGPGVEIRELPEIKPQKTVQRRAVQMRRIAGDFSAAIVNRNTVGSTIKTQLRLLTTPLYKYPTDVKNSDDLTASSVKSRGELIDGALFGFVQSTDPEVLLMLEVWRAENGKLSYTYSLSRMSMVYLQATYEDTVVWKTGWGNTQPTDPYFTVKSSDPWPTATSSKSTSTK